MDTWVISLQELIETVVVLLGKTMDIIQTSEFQMLLSIFEILLEIHYLIKSHFLPRHIHPARFLRIAVSRLSHLVLTCFTTCLYVTS